MEFFYCLSGGLLSFRALGDVRSSAKYLCGGCDGQQGLNWHCFAWSISRKGFELNLVVWMNISRSALSTFSGWLNVLVTRSNWDRLITFLASIFYYLSRNSLIPFNALSLEVSKKARTAQALSRKVIRRLCGSGKALRWPSMLSAKGPTCFA